jgi:phosphomannomutase
VADKDGLSAALCLARLAHELAARGQTLLDRLDAIEGHFGVHATSALALRVEGEDAPARIARAVGDLAAAPPARVGELAVTRAEDLAAGWRGLPPTPGVRLELGEFGRVVVRPSGTEPKVKAYLEITPPRAGALADQRARAAAWGAGALADLGARLGLGA